MKMVAIADAALRSPQFLGRLFEHVLTAYVPATATVKACELRRPTLPAFVLDGVEVRDPTVLLLVWEETS